MQAQKPRVEKCNAETRHLMGLSLDVNLPSCLRSCRNWGKPWRPRTSSSSNVPWTSTNNRYGCTWPLPHEELSLHMLFLCYEPLPGSYVNYGHLPMHSEYSVLSLFLLAPLAIWLWRISFFIRVTSHREWNLGHLSCRSLLHFANLKTNRFTFYIFFCLYMPY